MTAVSLAEKPFYSCYPVLPYRIFSNDRDHLKKRYDVDYVRLTSSIFMGERLKQTISRWCYMLWTQQPTMHMSFISILQTQMLVVPLRRCPGLCVKTSFVFTTGDNHRVIGLRPIATALGSFKLAALPAFHAFIGADITGRLSVKGKLLCWKTFMDAEDTITALGSLEATVLPPRRDIGPCGEVHNPSLSALNRCLKSQGTRMAYMYIQKKSGGIG